MISLCAERHKWVRPGLKQPGLNLECIACLITLYFLTQTDYT